MQKALHLVSPSVASSLETVTQSSPRTITGRDASADFAPMRPQSM